MNALSEKPKILIVDDVPVNLKVLKTILIESYDIFVTTDGAKALQLAHDNPPDLILLDIMMPNMDGFEVCKQLKEQPNTLDIPVIFITAMSEVGDEVQGFAAGAVDYITKPFNAAVVLARVITHLKMRAMQQALIRQNAALRKADELKADIERITRHDLKSPMNSIIGFSDLILRAKSDQISTELQKYVQIIHDSGRNALHMINLSLDLYKMEQGSYQMEPKTIDLLGLLHALCHSSSLSDYGKSRPITILVDGQPMSEAAPFLVFGEEILCYSIFSNLIKNALEASPQGKPITISLFNDGMPSVSIHNFGSMRAEIQERFFEKYATSGKRHGTGLGTYSARLMAKAQHGSIRMKTSEAQGTTLTVQLPQPAAEHCS